MKGAEGFHTGQFGPLPGGGGFKFPDEARDGIAPGLAAQGEIVVNARCGVLWSGRDDGLGLARRPQGHGELSILPAPGLLPHPADGWVGPTVASADGPVLVALANCLVHPRVLPMGKAQVDQI